MKSQQDIELSVFVRNPAKFEEMDISGVNVIKGDALNAGDVKRAMLNMYAKKDRSIYRRQI